MSLTLHIDTPAWREHLQRFAAQRPGLVPVAKGNGYGFGLERLAKEASLLAATDPTIGCVAAGIPDEVARLRAGGWAGDVVVLNPWNPGSQPETLTDPGVITTISRLEDLAAARAVNPRARILVELRTSMLRHGVTVDELARLADELGELRLEGWTIHLPVAGTGHLDEARALSAAALATRRAPLWLSHLTEEDHRTLAGKVGVACRQRIGTKLWLGDPGSRRVSARVLDVHPVRRGQRVGYWQHRMPTDGNLVIVGAGVSSGIALEAPSPVNTARKRLMSAATGAMASAGLALSPFRIGGRKRFFAEPPHMQSSLLFVLGSRCAEIGDEVEVEVRNTTTAFDRIEG